MGKTERGRELDIFYRLILSLTLAEDAGVLSRSKATQINTVCV